MDRLTAWGRHRWFIPALLAILDDVSEDDGVQITVDAAEQVVDGLG